VTRSLVYGLSFSASASASEKFPVVWLRVRDLTPSRCAQQCTQPPAVGIMRHTVVLTFACMTFIQSSRHQHNHPMWPQSVAVPPSGSHPPPSPLTESPSPSRHHHHHHRSPERELLHQPDCPHLRFREESLNSVNVPTENGFFALMKYTTASSRVCFKLRRSYIRL
jgi:hypothetical protein